MTKYIVVILLLSSCSKNNYKDGCKDGIRTWVYEHDRAGIEESVLEKGCLALQNKPRTMDSLK